MKLSTLCYLVKNESVLLAMKKRGFGMGKYNGIGGKLEGGESYEESAVREIQEEIGVAVSAEDLEDMGFITFSSENPQLNWKSKIFVVKNWRGTPVETEEMKPEWFLSNNIPYQKMWIDDSYWFPYTLRGERIDCEIYFNFDGTKVENFVIKMT
jgi:ADP-ribose pyrophosphatase YjhB (NUDIX family)